MTDKASIQVGETKLDVPIVVGTEDERAIDVAQLRAKTGYVTLDPAFMNTASTKSAITFIDGDKGILRYRGIPIEQLAEHSTFVETAYLLIYGHLPTEPELKEWSNKLTRHSLLHEDMKHFFEGFPPTAHPMAILSAMVTALSSYYPDALDVDNVELRDMTIARLVSKVRTIAAFAYKKSIGQPFVYPKNSLTYCANFLNMMYSVPAEDYDVDPELVKVMNLLLILHADHEQNCSTSTVRVVGSSRANLFASISAGISALWGPLHGGANQEVLEMLTAIHRDGGDVSKYVALAKDKNSTFRLQELRSPREDHQGRCRQGPRQARQAGSAARHRQGAGGGRAQGQLFRRAEAVPERRLLLGHHLPGDGLPHEHVHGSVRPGSPPRLDRPLEGDDGGHEHEDRAPAADLHRLSAARLRGGREARGLIGSVVLGAAVDPVLDERLVRCADGRSSERHLSSTRRLRHRHLLVEQALARVAGHDPGLTARAARRSRRLDAHEAGVRGRLGAHVEK